MPSPTDPQVQRPDAPTGAITTLTWPAVLIGLGHSALVAAGYLLTLLTATGATGDPIAGTIIGTAVVTIAVLVLRATRGQLLAYAPAPAPLEPRFLVLAGAALLAVFGLGQGLSLLAYQSFGSQAFDATNSARTAIGVGISLLLGLVVAPVGEETLLRGLLYPLLRARLPVGASVLLSSLTFAGLHANLVQFLATFPLAVVLALLYERTRSLGLCIGAHLVYNLMAIGLSPWAQLLAHPLLVAIALVAATMTVVLIRQPPPPASRSGRLTPSS